MYSRREFSKLALAGIPAALWGPAAQAQPTVRPNRSFINGVQFGLQPFCYHDLPELPENRGRLIERLVQNGFGMVELHATWVEPRFAEPGVTAQEARERLRQWRLTAAPTFYQSPSRAVCRAGSHPGGRIDSGDDVP